MAEEEKTISHTESGVNNVSLKADVSFPQSSFSSSKEVTPLLDSTRDIKPYKRRWYVLVVFSYSALLQALVWNTWGPIAQSAKLVFGWTDANIGMLANWGNIVQFLVLIPMAWVMDIKGMRVSMLLCSTMLLLGVSIRCITSDPEIATWLINAACICNGIGGSVPFAGPALFSATWFPPKQRATATAISSVSSYIGVSLAFIIGPLIVPEPINTAINMTDIISTNMSDMGNITLYNMTKVQDIEPQRDAIMRLMYMECGAVGLLFLLVLVYFPARPPSPPSLTASIERTSYTEGLKQLFRHKRFLLILLAYSIPTGVYGVFGAVIDVILNGVGISQNTAGWIGFYATVAGCAAGLFVSRIADMFMRRMKVLLLFEFVMATAATAWFVILRLGYIPFSMVSVYASTILTGVFINGAIPLFYELGCEASYPVAEGITTCFLALMNNLTGILFLSALQIPNIGVLWMNWALLGSVAITIPLLLVFKEKYTRTDIDTTTEIIIPPPEAGHRKSVNIEEES